MVGLFAVGWLAPFYFTAVPEIRSAYISCGNISDDRPSQTTYVRAGVDTGLFGRFGLYNWDVNSLTERLDGVHRHCLYLSEVGPTWTYDFKLSGSWRINTDFWCVCSMCRGYENDAYNRNYWWCQISQSLENPWVVPYYKLRRYWSGTYFLWFETGIRRRFALSGNLYLTPSFYVDGGDDRNFTRLFGANKRGDGWDGGVSSMSFRLEFGWKVSDWATLFAWIEQYEVVGGDARASNTANSCAHNDFTLGGVGLSLRF